MNVSLGFMTYKSADFIKRHLDVDYFKMSKGLINEIVIQDDYTDDYNILKPLETTNIKLFRNSEHLFPLIGRFNLVANCTNDWVLVMDSDNFLHEKSFDVIRSLSFNSDTIYCPDFGTPNFDYRALSDTNIDMQKAKDILITKNIPCFEWFLNTGNYLVPKRRYLEMRPHINNELSEYTVDVIYFNYLWLKNKNYLYCTKDFQYEHTLREDSYYRTHGRFSHEILANLMKEFIS